MQALGAKNLRTICFNSFRLKLDCRRPGGALPAASMGFVRGAFKGRAKLRLSRGRGSREGGSALVELTVVLFMVLTLSVLCFQTMLSGWLLQNWTIAQSMTNACAAIETANAQRWVFNEIVTSGRWSLYPQTVAVQFQIGSTPRGAVNTTVYRTYHFSQDPVTGLQTYLLESYVVYQDSLRTYCKLSKVVRSE